MTTATSDTSTKQDKLPVPDCQIELERTREAVAVSDEGQGAGLKSCPLSMTNLVVGGGGGGGGGGGASSSLLGSSVITARCAYAKSERRQQKRAFHRIMSGLEVARSRGQQVRFLTLTSPLDSTPETLSQHFRALKERIKRITPYKLVKGGWIASGDFHRYYPSRGMLDRLAFHYIAIKTAEGSGGGVLHILYAGDYLPRQWLSEAWLELHGAWNVDIRLGYGKRGLASYVVAQYCCGQSLFVVWRSFAKDWEYLKCCWRCARNGQGPFTGPKGERRAWDLDFASLLAQWRWHLQAGIPP